MTTPSKKLTEQLILAKTKSANINLIKNLNLWGNQLEDLSIISTIPNLEVISLSVNKIRTLKYFRNCLKLQELYLRKNCVEDIKEIKYLVDLPLLKILWLHDNPCTEVKNYRLIVVKFLIHLNKLDNSSVTVEEREAADAIIYDLGPKQPEKLQQQPLIKIQTQDYNDNKQIDIQEKPKESINQQMDEKKEKQFQEMISNSKKFKKKSMSMDFQNLDDFKHNLPDLPQPKEKSSPFRRSSNKIKKQEKTQKKKYETIQRNFQRNQNILMAVLSLMRELDPASIEIVKKQADKISRPF